MTKISNQYSLTNILTADLANSRLGINNVSPTVALDVTGAGKFSSSVTSDDLILTAGALFSAGNTGFSNRLSDTTLYLQMPATGFNITDNALNTRFILSSAGQLTSTKTSGIFLNNSSGGTNAVQLQINNTSGDLRLGIESSTGDTIQAGTSAYAAVFGNQANNATQFTTNGNVRMTITSGGQIGIGTSNPFGLSSSLLAISGNGNTYNLVNIQDTVNQNNCAFLQCLNASGVGIGEIRRIGTTNAVAFNTTSDYRLKEDFREIKGLEKISAIKVYDFKWKDNEFRMDGVLAHELQEIIPFAVTGDKDEVNNDGSIKTQGVDYSKIVPVLIKAIQELSAKVSLLENK